MKIFILAFLLMGAFTVQSQSVVFLRGDSVIIMKQGGFAELVLRNRTKDSLGILVNKGNGVTGFMRSRKINDSTLTIGLDTIHLSPSSGGIGSDSVLFGLTDTLATTNRIFNIGNDSFLIYGTGSFTNIRHGAINGGFEGWHEVVPGGVTLIAKASDNSQLSQIQMLPGSIQFLQYPDGNYTLGFLATTADTTTYNFMVLSDGAGRLKKIAIGQTGGGGGDSSVFATLYRLYKAIDSVAGLKDTVTYRNLGTGDPTIIPIDTSHIGVVTLKDSTGGYVHHHKNTDSSLTLYGDPIVNANLSGSAGITNANLATMPAHRFKANNTGSTAVPGDITATQATAELDVATTTLKGLVPAPGTATGKFLKDDMTWGTAGGSETLPQVLANGRTLNDDSVLLNTGKSLYLGKGGYVKEDSLYIGNVYASMATALIQIRGDSKWDHRGFYTTDTTKGVAYLIQAITGIAIDNQAVSGQSLVINFSTIMSGLKNGTPGSWFIIALGINDAITGQDTTVFKTDLGILIDSVVNRGIAANHIITVGVDIYNSYAGVTPTIVNYYNDIIRTLTASKGANFYDVYAALNPTGADYYTIDHLHGQNDWNYNVARGVAKIIQAGNPIQRKGQALAVNGLTELDKVRLAHLDNATANSVPVMVDDTGGVRKAAWNTIPMFNQPNAQVGSLNIQGDSSKMGDLQLSGFHLTNPNNRTSPYFFAGLNGNLVNGTVVFDNYLDISGFAGKQIKFNSRSATSATQQVVIGNGAFSGLVSGQNVTLLNTLGFITKSGTACGPLVTSLKGLSFWYDSSNVTRVGEIQVFSADNLTTFSNLALQRYGGHLLVRDTLPVSGDGFDFQQLGNLPSYFKKGLSIGTNRIDPSLLTIWESTTQGVRFPRLTTSQRNAMTGIADGATIYNSDSACNQSYDSVGAIWKNMSAASSAATYTFSTGLNNSSGTITANISTGVSGGQTIYGGTASGNNLTVIPTSHATKGKIILGSTSASAYDDVNTRLGIGTASPTAALDIVGAVSKTVGITDGTNYNLRISGSSTAQAVRFCILSTGSQVFGIQNSDGAAVTPIMTITASSQNTNFTSTALGTAITVGDGANGSMRFSTPANLLSAITTPSGQAIGFGNQTSNGSTFTEWGRWHSSGNYLIGTATDSSARLHLGAGSSSLAPLKFTAGAVLTTPKNGVVEFDGTNYYLTAGSTRYQTALVNRAQTWSGAQDMTGATVTVTTQSAADNSTKAASTAYVDNAVAFPGWTTITSGTGITLGQSYTAYDPATLQASTSFSLPSGVPNGTLVRLFFGGTITSGAVVTALTITGAGGTTILDSNLPTTANSGDSFTWRFQSTGSYWRREK